MYPREKETHIARIAPYVRVDEIAAEAFYVAAADCGLEDLTDACGAMENGIQYQEACVVLTRGKSVRTSEEIARVRIPATRGRVNACAWYSALFGHEVDPYECPMAFIECDPKQPRALIYGDNAYKATKDGRLIPRKVGLQRFVETDIAPILAAYVWEATDSDVWHIAYVDDDHKVTF